MKTNAVPLRRGGGGIFFTIRQRTKSKTGQKKQGKKKGEYESGQATSLRLCTSDKSKTSYKDIIQKTKASREKTETKRQDKVKDERKF